MSVSGAETRRSSSPALASSASRAAATDGSASATTARNAALAPEEEERAASAGGAPPPRASPSIRRRRRVAALQRLQPRRGLALLHLARRVRVDKARVEAHYRADGAADVADARGEAVEAAVDVDERVAARGEVGLQTLHVGRHRTHRRGARELALPVVRLGRLEPVLGALGRLERARAGGLESRPPPPRAPSARPSPPRRRAPSTRTPPP